MAYSLQSRKQPSAKVTTTRSRDLNPREEIRIVLLGKTGNGKSASGNTILNRKAFTTELSPCSVTSECEKVKGVVDGRKVAVIDTPGIYDTKYKENEVLRKLKECISLSAPGPHVFLIVINLDRFTEEEQKTVELLQMVFGDKAASYSLVLFTHGDRLGRTRIEDFFRKSPQLSHLIAKCNWRYHVFNNMVSNASQVSQLLTKIMGIICNNAGTFYTNKMFQEAERAIQEQAKRILKFNAEKKHKDEEKLRARFEGEQLQAELKRLQDGYEKKSREKAEKICIYCNWFDCTRRRNRYCNWGCCLYCRRSSLYRCGSSGGWGCGGHCWSLGTSSNESNKEQMLCTINIKLLCLHGQ